MSISPVADSTSDGGGGGGDGGGSSVVRSDDDYVFRLLSLFVLSVAECSDVKRIDSSALNVLTDITQSYIDTVTCTMAALTHHSRRPQTSILDAVHTLIGIHGDTAANDIVNFARHSDRLPTRVTVKQPPRGIIKVVTSFPNTSAAANKSVFTIVPPFLPPFPPPHTYLRTLVPTKEALSRDAALKRKLDSVRAAEDGLFKLQQNVREQQNKKKSRNPLFGAAETESSVLSAHINTRFTAPFIASASSLSSMSIPPLVRRESNPYIKPPLPFQPPTTNDTGVRT